MLKTLPEILKPSAQVHTTAQLRLTRVILNPDGTEAKRTEWQKNLILDAGLDMVAVTTFANCTLLCHAGTGTNPFQRDSGVTTVSVTALVATASANYFEAADVGRLLRLDSGQEYYISVFTNATTVSLVAGPNAAAAEATIWYVNRTQLQTELKRTDTFRTTSGDCGTTYDGVLRRFVHRRSHLFTTEVGAVTYRELGWGYQDNLLLFSGVVISGPGDSLVAGQQYMVISELIFTPTPTVTVVAPNVGSGGWNSAGNINIETYQSNTGEWATVNSSGQTTGPQASTAFTMEPSTAGGWTNVQALLANFTIVSPMSATPTSFAGGTITVVASLIGTYSPSQFYRDKGATFGVSVANAPWFGVSLGTVTHRVLTVKFDATQTKANINTVTVRFRLSWGRTLIN